MVTEVPETTCYVPLNIDTEFQAFLEGVLEWEKKGGVNLTCQVRAINEPEFKAYSHPQAPKFLKDKYPEMAEEFVAFDYLKQLGYLVNVERVEKFADKLPILEIGMYAHFAVAEVNRVFLGSMAEYILSLQTKRKGTRIEMGKRLRFVTEVVSKSGKQRTYDHLDMPYLVILDGVEFRLRLSVHDSGGLHGVASYAKIAKSVGFKLQYKDVLSKSDKRQMLATAKNRPDDFHNYMGGDTYVYEILEANANKFKQLYVEMGVSPWYEVPKMTAGATTAQAIRANMLKYFRDNMAVDEDGFSRELDRETLEKLIEPGNSATLSQETSQTSALLAKVQGGRCRNNNPLATSVIDLILDSDIGGAYVEAQRSLMFPFGKPAIVSYKAASTNNDYLTLETFLDGGKDANGKRFKGIRNQLVDGLFDILVSTESALNYPQDYFPSWFVGGSAKEDVLAKYVAKKQSETEQEETPLLNVDDGNLKILKHEILNGVITTAGLDWLDYVASEKQRKELYQKLRVKAAIFYPAKFRVSNIDELLERRQNWVVKNSLVETGIGNWETEDNECPYWFAAPISELYIDNFRYFRKIAQAQFGKKSPEDELYKLLGNVSYGDAVSKDFPISNVVVANNITANCRALCYYMEKGFNGYQAITDGVALRVNKVIFPRKQTHRITAVDLVEIYQADERGGNIVSKPLGGYDFIRASFNIKYLKKDGSTSFAPTLFLERHGESKTYSGLGVKKKERLTITCVESVEVIESTNFYQNEDGETVFDNLPMKWLDKTTLEHLKTLFPKVAVLHETSQSLSAKKINGEWQKVLYDRVGLFELEGKNLYFEASFHGASNYMFDEPKMRSYEKASHQAVVMNNGKLVYSNRYWMTDDDIWTPAKDILTAIKSDPTALPRQEPFAKEAILKTGQYRQRLEFWQGQELIPGHSFYKAGLLREFSLSQFTFRTLDQLNSWEKVVSRLKEKYGQSLEMFFLNDDETLNFQLMVSTVNEMVNAGVMNPLEVFDKQRRKRTEHPHFQAFLALKELIKSSESDEPEDE
jgi:hypothetical protein